MGISIHAPAKGATAELTYRVVYAVISIHAPAKGATAARQSYRPAPRDFNPRSREGSDYRCTWQLHRRHDFNPRSREGSDRLAGALVHHLIISIHAPAKGATAKITKTIPDDFHKINNYNNSFA